MAIKHLTVSALTGGVLMLGYAAWSKWRGASLAQFPPSASPPELDELDPEIEIEQPADASSDLQAELDAEAEIKTETGLDADALDLAIDDIWDSRDSMTANPHEQVVDFSAEATLEDEEGSVAPEDLGVRWLTRATEAMSPFHHARQDAEAALIAEAMQRSSEGFEAAPEGREQDLDSIDVDLDEPVSKPL